MSLCCLPRLYCRFDVSNFSNVSIVSKVNLKFSSSHFRWSLSICPPSPSFRVSTIPFPSRWRFRNVLLSLPSCVVQAIYSRLCLKRVNIEVLSRLGRILDTKFLQIDWSSGTLSTYIERLMFEGKMVYTRVFAVRSSQVMAVSLAILRKKNASSQM